ncbi:STAS domain-containing protein [Actinoplanes palleronii]|uniref:STAS domain-containing protein n=1 Tax=Actinoplanes palleronii TaxID=113570 RepID=A0ABQ4BQ51_9ACTN|nr:STAS domain-containing protein [Actinoplanes palleronii]GIE72799.1 hypothetical protein Apa02nite_089070 [Actinoplanes palleronii]
MTDDYYTIATGPAAADAGGVATVRVTLAGSFDIGARDELRDALLAAVDAGAPGGRVLVDLGQVRFVDSEAISALIQGYLSAETAGLSLRLTGATGVVAKVLTVIGLDHLREDPAPGS